MCTMGFRTKPKEVYLIIIHALTGNDDEADKDYFYEEITRIYDRLPGNVIKIMLGDANTKIEKKVMYVPTFGLESAHEETNDNGQRLISFVTSRNLEISNTTFSPTSIYKYT